MSEIWKDIVGYEGLYQVSNLGNVMSLSYGAKNIRKSNKRKLLKQSTTNCGYVKVQLYNNGKPKMKYVHRLVAEAFIPNPCKKPQVNHIDGNKQNNSVSNLEWVSASDNKIHALANGLSVPPMTGRKGKDNPCSKPILQYDLNGNFIQRWDSITQATIALGKKYGHIQQCLSKRRPTAYGFKWEYE